MALFKIVVWAIIFLTKLRFPPGISIATILQTHVTVSKLYTTIQIYVVYLRSNDYQKYVWIFLVPFCIKTFQFYANVSLLDDTNVK